MCSKSSKSVSFCFVSRRWFRERSGGACSPKKKKANLFFFSSRLFHEVTRPFTRDERRRWGTRTYQGSVASARAISDVGGAAGSPGAGGGVGGGGAGASAASRACARSNSSKTMPATRAMASPVTRSTQLVNLRAFRRHACTDGRMMTPARGVPRPPPRGDARGVPSGVRLRSKRQRFPGKRKIFCQSDFAPTAERPQRERAAAQASRPIAPPVDTAHCRARTRRREDTSCTSRERRPRSGRTRRPETPLSRPVRSPGTCPRVLAQAKEPP